MVAEIARKIKGLAVFGCHTRSVYTNETACVSAIIISKTNLSMIIEFVNLYIFRSHEFII